MTKASAQFLDQARLAWRRSPLPAFLRWWGGELTALLPARLRACVRRGPDVLWLSADAAGVQVRRARDGETLVHIASDLPLDLQREEFVQACAGIERDDRRLRVWVPAAQVLYRRLLMPLAVAADPRRAIGFELDRQTPFKAEQLYFDVRISHEMAPAGQLLLDLYAAPRALIDPLLERFNALGAQPDAIDAERSDGAPAGIDLLPPARRPRRVDKRRRVNAMLAAACVVLVVLVLQQWLGNRRAALAGMQADVEEMRMAAGRSEQLRAQLTGAIAASKFLVRRKAEQAGTLAVLDELTKRLPATASLNAMTLDESGAIDLRGEASEAAALVDTLRTSKLIKDPRLQGVIEPDRSTGKDRFALVARVNGTQASDAN